MRCVHVAAAIAALLLVAVSLPGEEKDGKGWKSLFNGKDTTGWKLRADKIKITKIVDPDGKDIAGTKRVNKDGKTIIVDKNGEEIKDAKVVEMTVDNPSGWTVEKEELISSKPHHGNDLLTDEKFTDFALHVEFQATSNSGVYLQGRYEIQINNDEKAKPKLVEKDGKQVEVWDTHICGAIYGRIAPSKNMCKAAHGMADLRRRLPWRPGREGQGDEKGPRHPGLERGKGDR